MAAKQSVLVNFARGLDTKSDPNQIQVGNFLALKNSIFDVGGRLTKRAGNTNITSLPNDVQTTLTTFSGNLLATGSNLYAFSADTNQWLDQGTIQPVDLSVQTLVRSSASQTAPDMAVASNGLACLVFMEGSAAYYQISDSITGQQIVHQTMLPTNTKAPRVFLLGRYFIITFLTSISSTPVLQYVAIPIANPTDAKSPVDISANVNSLSTSGYDAIEAGGFLYFGWEASAGNVNMGFLSSTLVVSPATVIAGHTANLVSMVADTSGTTPVIWCSIWSSAANNGFTFARSHTLAPILAPTATIVSTAVYSLTSVAVNGVCTLAYEIPNNYASPYPGTVASHYVETQTVTQSGTVSSPVVMLRSVGLASKIFTNDTGVSYVIVTYGENFQPTYFLADLHGNLYMRLAYSNGGGYVTTQVLANITLFKDQFYMPYLFKDLLTTINKGTNTGEAIPSVVYSQTGVNFARFGINTSGQYSSEIAGALHLTGGQLWEYDGVKPVEHGFQVWPENLAFTTVTTGGLLTAQTYNYVATYEWTDGAGNLQRSAPSVPLVVDLTSSGTATNTNTVYVPTLRLTYKTGHNDARVVVYRWSTSQQTFFQLTSVSQPVLNDPTIDYIPIVDTLSDNTILGNPILYTTGGVVENIAAPASAASVLFKNRLFILDAEDRNLLWYSKQVIEATPVEMSDLFTLYVAPTTGSQQSTGPVTALSAMDDKLIIFKKDAIYYLTGTGPDNAGAQNDFSDPIYITASVGTTNPNSIVVMPTGIMFQSDKGIWLLGRDLSTQYIGAGVEQYNADTVMSASAIPGTNQVRFVLNTNVTLMYDYYYQQWGTFSNIFAISACLYQGKHTYLNSFGRVFQETPGIYTDGSIPVLMSFTTGWVSAAGIRGYERFYNMFLLGTYVTPFQLQVLYGFDYSQNPVQSIIVKPTNYSPVWGADANWGANVGWGGPGNVFMAEVSPKRQKCQTFQITVNEIYDPSFGVPAGEGFSLSGMNIVVGVKKSYSPQRATKSFG